jgi:hypothetical protein
MKRRLRILVRRRHARRLRAGVEPRPRRALGRRRAVVAVGLAVLVASAAAWAYWGASGSGTASGSVGSLAAPTEVGASTSGNSSTVSVSWTASEAVSGLTPSGYYVKRYNGATATTAGGTCGTPAEPVNQTSCNDTGVADGTYTYAVVAVYRSWNAESAHSSSVTVVSDNEPPTTAIELSPATPNGSNGWYSTTPSFTLSASDSGSGVASTKYQIDGGITHTYTGSPVEIADGQHTVSYWSVDNAGNTETAHTTGTIKVDTVAPTSSLSLGSSPTHAILAGSTLYFNSAAGGSFTVVNTVSDGTSGPASATFPLVSATNWTHPAETVTTPSGGPYSSSTYSWTSGAGTPSGAQASFTSADRAGNASTASALTFTPDATAPTGGALSVNGTVATAGGSTSTSTSTSFAIDTRTDYSEAQSPSQSGLASSTLTIQSETLTGNVCGAPGSGGAYASATTISGTTQPTIETGYCYLYTLTGTDNVGNAATVKTTVKVDTTAPSSPSVSLSAATGNTFVNGTTVYIDPQAGRSGSFTATGSSSDAESGVSSITLPSLSGFSSGGGTVASPFETTYKWTGAVAASGAQSATATNGAGLTATNSSAFTVTPDTTAPTGGTLSVNGTAASAGGSTSTATTTGFAIGSRTDYSETQSASQSGLASSSLTIRSETLTGNVCGAPGSGGPYTSPTTISGTTQPTIETGFCYLYTLTGTDNVGNAASVGTTVKVDTTGPSSPTVSLSSATGSTFISGTTVYINAQAGKEGSFKATGSSSDAETGISSIKLPALTGFSEGGGTLSSPFETKYKWSGAVGASGAQSVTATNGFGLTTTNASAFTVTSDTSAPTGGALSVNGTAASAGGSTSTSTETGFAIGSRTDYSETQSASQSGLASSTLTIQSETLTGNVCGAPGSGGPYTSPTTISGTTQPTIETGFCYLYTLTGTDNVGNAASVKTTVKVDTTGPSSPTVSLSSATGNTFISGTTVYINAQAGKEGSFKATGASTDGQTGVTSIALPALTGFSEGGGTLSSPFETKYKWSGAVGASGAQSVTATNGFGLTTTNPSAFTVAPDTTAPSSAGTVTVPARVHTTSVSVTFSGAVDAGSGISTGAGELLRAEATYTVGTDTCGSFGSFAKVGSAGPASPFSDTTVVNNKCYEYEYKASDNVGNTTTSGASGTAKVDTTAPKASAITAVNGTGATAHKTDAKDVITYTFSENVDPSTITSAWSTASTPDQTVTMTFRDTGEGNGTNKPDVFEVTTAGVHLGSVEMSSGNWVPSKSGSYSFSSTMHFSTVEEKVGEQKSRVTITLNSLNSGGSTVGTESAADTFKWTPDAAITDLAGNAADTATKAENKAEHF